MKRRTRAPHSAEQFCAIVRTPKGRAYRYCVTRAQALAHKPYIVERINGFGQVVERERIAS